MENVELVKNNIKRANKVFRKNKNIAEYLDKAKISNRVFLLSIGVNPSFLYSKYAPEIEKLVFDIIFERGIVIDYDEQMFDLEGNSITLTCLNLGFEMTFLPDRIMIIKQNIEITEDKIIETSENYGFLLKENITKLVFSHRIIKDKSLSEEKVVSQKYPLDYVDIHASLENNQDKDILQIEFSAPDLLSLDFNRAISILYDFNFSIFYKYLNNIKTSESILLDDFYQNNMHNNRDR